MSYLYKDCCYYYYFEFNSGFDGQPVKIFLNGNDVTDMRSVSYKSRSSILNSLKFINVNSGKAI